MSYGAVTMIVTIISVSPLLCFSYFIDSINRQNPTCMHFKKKLKIGLGDYIET